LGDTVEIRSVLRLDDQSSAVVDKLKSGYEHLGERVHEVEHEMASMLKQTLAVAAGFQLSNGIESVKEFGHELIDAAKNAGMETKQLAGAIAMGDKSGQTYESLTAKAGKLHEELEDLGVAAGASTSSIVDAFTTIQARSQKSAEEVRGLTEQMVYASRAVPGGMEGMANSFRDLESGIVRPRNAMVQLMVMTGTVEGSAKKVAKGLNAMMQQGPAGMEKVTALAEQAISKMAEKMKAAPMTFGQVVDSLKDLREQAFEAMGGPILKAIQGPLGQLRRYFMDNKKSLEEWATMAGEKVGVWINEAATKIQEGFQYLKTHATEIKDAIVSAANVAKSVVEWIIAHREMIAIAFGAKLGIGALGSLASGVGSGIGAVKGIAAAGAPALGIAGGTAAAFAATVAAFAAAVGAWTWAISEWNKLQDLTHGKSDALQNEEARKVRLQQMGGSVDKINTKEFDQLRKKFVEQADAMGMTERAAGAYADSLWNQHRALREMADQADAAATKADRGQEFEGASDLVVLYDKAVQTHNTGMMQYVANVLAGNQTLQNALLASGANVEGGFDALGDLVMGKSEEFGKILKGMGNDAGKGKLPEKMSVNFNGSTFNIKQDFRDQDPDRIMLTFKRDLVRAAVNRSQAHVGTSFGM